jgi:CubicO group peptidase (beta-lactamase class C family)
MKRFTKVLGALVIALSLNQSVIYAQDSTEIEGQIDQLFEDWSRPNTPGAAVSVIKDGQVVYTKGFGSANLEYNIPITPKTIFHAASLSKQFTAFAILLLEEDGKLSLDDDVRKYIPEVPDFGKTITLKNLANHSSGLRDQWRLLEMAGWRMDDVITSESIFQLIESQNALNFTTGAQNMYSNTGYTLLAEVVARVSGKSFPEFTKERIFKPLGMLNTQFYDDCEKIVVNRAYSYHSADSVYKKSNLNFSTVGPTSLFVTVEDFALWAMNFENPKVGNAAIIKTLNTRPPLNNGPSAGYALGQIRGFYQGIEVFVHSGSDAGFRAYFVRVPAHNLAVVVLGNLSSMTPIIQAFGIVNLFVSDSFKELDAIPIFEPDESKIISLESAALKKFEGDYFEPLEGYSRKINIKNDTLMFSRTDSESKLVPVGPSTFKMLGDSEDVTVEFVANKNGDKHFQFYINDRVPIAMFTTGEVKLEDYTGKFYSEELMAEYVFEIEGDKLVAKHLQLGTIEFEPVQKDVFTSKNRNYKKALFIRDSNGLVIGLVVSNGGVVNLKFDKQ